MAGMGKRQRTDADRRVRQCERLGRLLRLLQLIMGKGRWDAPTLAQELGCSKRTVHRLLQTLSLAAVPWYFDESVRAYRVRPGFKFPMIEPAMAFPLINDMGRLVPLIDKAIVEGKALLGSLEQLQRELRDQQS